MKNICDYFTRIYVYIFFSIVRLSWDCLNNILENYNNELEIIKALYYNLLFFRHFTSPTNNFLLK